MSARKVALADVLWDAANKHLAPGASIFDEAGFDFSCEAVGEALGITWDNWDKFVSSHPATRFLRDLGCRCGSSHLFDKFEDREVRQGARYLWLLLAMHVAESEGIEIEIEGAR